jgi:mediator of replication checkpoint protein 1
MVGDRISTSDPIEAFSSPSNAKCGTSEHSFSPRRPHQSPALNGDQEFSDPNDSDDSDLPETSDMFKQNIEDSKKKQNLKEAKARALACLQPPAMHSDDDDDCLEIVAFSRAKTVVKEEDIQRKSRSKLQISEGRKRQMQFGKVSLAMHENELPFTFSSAQGGLAKLADQTILNQLIAAEARKEAQRVTRKKEEEWRKHGGQTNNNVGQSRGLAKVFKTIAEKGLKVAKARETDKADINDSEDEGSDEDWEPKLRGSASPKILPVNADSEPHENLPPNHDVSMIDEFEVMEDDANIRGRTARRRIIDSESEDENENENAPPGVLAISREEGYRRSTSLYELPTEDEYDKENNVSLMYDRSEDKENNAVVRHSTSIFDIRSDSPSLSDFTQSSSLNEKALLDDPNLDRRRPLGELLSEESSIASPIIPTNFTQSFAAKLQQASPSSKTLTSFLSREGLQPAFDSFSQFSEVESERCRPAPLLQPGFSELFESATEKRKPRDSDGQLSDDVSLIHFHLTSKLDIEFFFSFYFEVSFRSRGIEETSTYRYFKSNARCHPSIPGREQINAQS